MIGSPRSHLYLIGYRGSGKSSIGASLAPQLRLPFVDTDVLIESKASTSIAEIFASVGEVGFRELESDAIRSLPSEPHVVALGGGAVLREENRSLLKSNGRCVWLSASPKLLEERIVNDVLTSSRRPRLSKLGVLDEIESILATREPLYRELAELVVDIEGKSIADIAKFIANWWNRIEVDR